MKLSWFSPLPPAKTAVAHYTASLLPALCQVADVTLWTDQSQWDIGFEDYATVRGYDAVCMPWSELNRADMSVYHIGNSPFHGAIWRVSREAPGVVVLHDGRVQDLVRAAYQEHGRRAAYLDVAEQYYGVRGRNAAADFWSDTLPSAYMAERYPLTPLAVAGALGVLVHTRDTYLAVQQSFDGPSAHVALPYCIAASPAGRRWAPPYRLVMFGYLDWNRRLKVVLDALAQFPERDRLRLDIYGSLFNEEDVRAHLESLGLRGVVTLHGFVPAAQLDAALAGAHLAINLRSPTMGEASFSQLQLWAHGLPSLVTPAGWYATLPPDTVAFVRPDRELDDLHTHWRALLADAERFARMGEAGRRHLEAHHTPAAYARAVIDLAAEAERFRAYAAAYQLADRAATKMSAWLGPAASPQAFRRAATAINRLVNGWR